MVGHTQDAFVSFPPAAVENITRILRGERPLLLQEPEVIPACSAGWRLSAPGAFAWRPNY